MRSLMIIFLIIVAKNVNFVTRAATTPPTKPAATTPPTKAAAATTSESSKSPATTPTLKSSTKCPDASALAKASAGQSQPKGPGGTTATAQGFKVGYRRHRHVVLITKEKEQTEEEPKTNGDNSEYKKKRQATPEPEESPGPAENKTDNGMANLQPIVKEGRGEDYEYLGAGNIITTRWVLTSNLVVSDSTDLSKLVLVPGLEVPVDNFSVEIRVKNMSKFKPERPQEYLPNHKILVLLRVNTPLVFGSDQADVFLVFNERDRTPRLFSHCEIISYYFNAVNKSFIKTEIPVKLVHQSDKCYASDTTETCIKVLLKSSEFAINPCYEPDLNVGAPIMCDVALEGIFYGYAAGQGCSELGHGGLRGFLIRDHKPTIRWIYNTLKDEPKPILRVNDDYSNLESIDYNYLFEFVMENFTTNRNFHHFFTGKPVYRRRVPPTPKKKCSKGDRWDSRFFIVMLITVLCKYIF